QEILTGIDIPIEVFATIRAVPFTDMEWLLAIAVSAGRTNLTGWIKSIRFDDCPSFLFRFVFQLTDELIPPDIPDAFCQFMILHQIIAVQRLDNDDLVFVRYLIGQFMQEIYPLIGNLFMLLSDLDASFVSILSAFLFAGQRTLSFLELLFCFVQMFWIFVFNRFS